MISTRETRGAMFVDGPCPTSADKIYINKFRSEWNQTVDEKAAANPLGDIFGRGSPGEENWRC
jgi:hypothetical protein